MAERKKTDRAVALRYDKKLSSAPQVLASGAGLIARKIIETARESGVHIKEDPDLVELLARVPVGQEIPEELYQTVAELLAFIYSVNKKFKTRHDQQP